MTIEDKSIDTTPPSCSPSEGLSSLYSQIQNDDERDEERCNIYLFKDDKLTPHIVLNKVKKFDAVTQINNSSVDDQELNDSSSVELKRAVNSVEFSKLSSFDMHKLSCDPSQLFSPIAVLRIILLVCSFMSLLCVISCHTNQHSGFTKLPSADRLQFHVVICILSVIITLILLLTDVTNFIQFLYRTPFNWPLCETIIKGILCILLIVSTSLLLHVLLEYGSNYRWVSFTTRGLLLASLIFGLLSLFCSFILAIISWLGQEEYKIFQEESRRSGNEYLVT